MTSRINRELRTVERMISLYCKKHHSCDFEDCTHCVSLRDYAVTKTKACRFGDNKPVCSLCPVHCYKKDERNKIREVMRYSGPQMVLRYPYLAVMHLVDKQASKKNYNI